MQDVNWTLEEKINHNLDVMYSYGKSCLPTGCFTLSGWQSVSNKQTSKKKKSQTKILSFLPCLRSGTLFGVPGVKAVGNDSSWSHFKGIKKQLKFWFSRQLTSQSSLRTLSQTAKVEVMPKCSIRKQREHMGWQRRESNSSRNPDVLCRLSIKRSRLEAGARARRKKGSHFVSNEHEHNRTFQLKVIKLNCTEINGEKTGFDVKFFLHLACTFFFCLFFLLNYTRKTETQL